MPSEIAVRLDDAEVRAYLDTLTPPEIKKFLRKAATRAGAAERKIIKSGVPAGATGNLRSSVSARRIRKNNAIGVVVGPMGKKGRHRHLVVGGTRPHIILPTGQHKALRLAFGFAELVEHPGSRPNPFLDRVATSAAAAGVAAAERVIDEVVK